MRWGWQDTCFFSFSFKSNCSYWNQIGANRPKSPGLRSGESRGQSRIIRRLVVFKTFVWLGKPGEPLWGHPPLPYKLRGMPAGASTELNAQDCWPVTPAQPLCESPCNLGEGTTDLCGSHSSSSSFLLGGFLGLPALILHKLDLIQTIPKINSWLKFVFFLKLLKLIIW